MKTIDLDSPYIRFVNAAATEQTKTGFLPLRFPQATLETFGGMAPIARFSTGIELQLHGRVKTVTAHIRVVDSDGFGVCLEAYRGPNKVLPTWCPRHDTVEVQSQTYTVQTACGTDYPFRLLLPTHSAVEIVDVQVDDDAELLDDFQVYDHRRLPRGRDATWIAHGDSITHGASVTCPSHTWVDLIARDLRIKPVNLGIGGHGQAELPVAEYLASRTDADILSLHIGVNAAITNRVNAFADRIGPFLETIRTGRPDLPILVSSPIFCHFDMNGGQSRAQVVRHILRDECERRAASGDDRLTYVDGLEMGFDESLLLSDCLHISEAGAIHYTRMLKPHIEQLVTLAEGQSAGDRGGMPLK